jgi:hypothetical protein
MGRDQAAGRRSRAGGHPCHHATTSPVTAMVVTGAAATAAGPRKGARVSRRVVPTSRPVPAIAAIGSGSGVLSSQIPPPADAAM